MTLGQEWMFISVVNKEQLDSIYRKYCAYKEFDSVMPMFLNEYKRNELLGYYENGELVAWDMVEVLDNKNVEALQFAWDYKNPKLRLGLRSIENACAVYKQRGFRYLWLGQHAPYKEKIDGHEIPGRLE